MDALCRLRPAGRKRCSYSAYCKKLGECTKAYDLAAHMAYESSRLMLVDWASRTVSIFDAKMGKGLPTWLLVAVFPVVGAGLCRMPPRHEGSLSDSRARPRVPSRRGVPGIFALRQLYDCDRLARRSELVMVNGAYPEMAGQCDCAVASERVRGPRGVLLGRCERRRSKVSHGCLRV